MNTTNIFKRNLKALDSGKTIMVNQGGTSSSKTYSILQTIIFLAQINKNKIFSIVSETMPHLRKGAIRDFFSILEKDNLFKEEDWNKTSMTYKLNDNIIEFFSVDNQDRCRGSRRDYLFINECNNIRYDTFDQLEIRTRVATFLDYNPVSNFWVQDKVIPLNNSQFIHSTYLDNPYLEQKIIDGIERKRELDPNGWRVYGLGETGSLEGIIFNNWTQVDEIPQTLNKIITNYVYGLDFGFTNDPTAIILVSKQGGEIYLDEIYFGFCATNYDISTILEQNEVLKTKEIYCDSAEPKSIYELKDRGWNTLPVEKTKVLDGINKIKEYKLNVTKRSTNLIKELRNYSWMKNRDGTYINTPVGPDHCIDAFRYGFTMLEKGIQYGGFAIIRKK